MVGESVFHWGEQSTLWSGQSVKWKLVENTTTVHKLFRELLTRKQGRAYVLALWWYMYSSAKWFTFSSRIRFNKKWHSQLPTIKHQIMRLSDYDCLYKRIIQRLHTNSHTTWIIALPSVNINGADARGEQGPSGQGILTFPMPFRLLVHY